MLRWFSFAFVDQFCDELLHDLSPLLAAMDESSGSATKVKKAVKRQQQLEMALSTLHRRAVEFGRRERLNVFQKARLSKHLQDRLIECGHAPAFAKGFSVRVISDLR